MVEVLVPATSANLGAGFDVLGLALNLYNSFTVSEIETGIEIVSDESVYLPQGADNLVFTSAKRLFDETGYSYRGLRITIKNGVPMGRGLGSSSTAIVGGLLAANEIAGSKLSRDELFELATEIEGHPDNVGPAIFGGFTICYKSRAGYRSVHHIPAENLKPILLIPGTELETKRARAVLPSQISMSDAVFNIGRSSLLVAAILIGRADLLSDAMQDKLHQPYRAPMIPGLMEIISGLEGSSRAGVALSGAGPSIVCLIDRADETEFSQRAQEAIDAAGQAYQVRPAEFDTKGARIISS